MGSEQSTQASSRGQSVSRLTRGNTIATPQTKDVPVGAVGDSVQSGNTSPGASVCSDTDLPYISYTLNRPIGDSPKLTNKSQSSARRGGLGSQRRGMSISSASSTSSQIHQQRRPIVPFTNAHTIVVVKEAAAPQSSDRDEDLLKLQQIPMFLPIMRGALGLPGARDPEILEGISTDPWLRLAVRLQTHMSQCATVVANDQAIITARCKEMDQEVSRLLTVLVERQRRGAKLAERLSQVRPLSQQLTRCHSLLNHALMTLQDIDALLPPEDRMEPFVWTTG